MDRRLLTRLRDGHTDQNGAVAHGEISAGVDEASQSDTTGMAGCVELLP